MIGSLDVLVGNTHTHHTGNVGIGTSTPHFSLFHFPSAIHTMSADNLLTLPS